MIVEKPFTSDKQLRELLELDLENTLWIDLVADGIDFHGLVFILSENMEN